jgi:cellulose synthase/poly-beta-1,6-N-acetylglucosamine synthase-like glycosyltransferase
MLIKLFVIVVVISILITWMRAIQRGSHARQIMKQARWRLQGFPEFRLGNTFETGGATPTGTNDEGLQPSVSILVPAWNERGTIEKCIRSLQALDYLRWEALILAGGADGTYEAAQQFTAGDARFRVLERGPEPKNAAINRGIAEAKNEIVVLLDADSIVESGWLAALVEPIAAGASACIGMHYPAEWSWVSEGEYMEIVQSYHILGTNLGQGCSSLAVRRDVMKRISPLPVNAFSWEDADVGVRLEKEGEKVAFAGSALLKNERPASLVDYWNTAIRVHRAHLMMLWHWRKMMIRQPMSMLFQWYFHILSLVLLIGGLAGVGIALSYPSQAGTVGQIAGLAALWMFGRRAALAGEIAAYTGEAKWLSRSWIPPILLLVQLITANIGLFTLWKAVPFDYKGHREV